MVHIPILFFTSEFLQSYIGECIQLLAELFTSLFTHVISFRRSLQVQLVRRQLPFAIHNEQTSGFFQLCRVPYADHDIPIPPLQSHYTDIGFQSTISTIKLPSVQEDRGTQTNTAKKNH